MYVYEVPCPAPPPPIECVVAIVSTYFIEHMAEHRLIKVILFIRGIRAGKIQIVEPRIFH